MWPQVKFSKFPIYQWCSLFRVNIKAKGRWNKKLFFYFYAVIWNDIVTITRQLLYQITLSLRYCKQYWYQLKGLRLELVTRYCGKTAFCRRYRDYNLYILPSFSMGFFGININSWWRPAKAFFSQYLFTSICDVKRFCAIVIDLWKTNIP